MNLENIRYDAPLRKGDHVVLESDYVGNEDRKIRGNQTDRGDTVVVTT